MGTAIITLLWLGLESFSGLDWLCGLGCLGGLGWLFFAVLSPLGLGAVVLTRFGTQDYTSNGLYSNGSPIPPRRPRRRLRRRRHSLRRSPPASRLHLHRRPASKYDRTQKARCVLHRAFCIPLEPHTLNLGSIASRKPSPMRFTANTVSVSSPPDATATQGAWRR